ncbi:MAG: AI-2E family transporter [Pirellulaceae bacterium]
MIPVSTTTAWQRISPTLATLAILALATGFLYLARPVLIPTALAILITFMLGPVVLFIQRRGVPRVPAVLAVVAAAGLIAALLAWLFFSQTIQLADDLPRYQARVTERIQSLRTGNDNSILSKIQTFVEQVSQAVTKSNKPSLIAEGERPATVVLAPSDNSWIAPLFAGLGPLLEPLAAAGLVFILVIYALIEREDLRDRLLRLIGRGHMTLTTVALDDAGYRISRYLLAQFILNASFGVVIALGLLLLGVPHALLWGIFAAFLRYIPVVGPWIAAILPVSLSIMTADGWLQPALVVALFASFELLSNLVIEPRLYGQTMGVSQSGLILAIAFWTWLWGPMGLVLAAPLTVCLMILGRYVPALKFFDVLLGDQPSLTADVRFYQRLLAHDQDEASRIARELMRKLSLPQVYDQILIPTLTYASQDMESGRLSALEAGAMWRSCGEIAEELELLSDVTASAASSEAPASAEIRAPHKIHILACAARDDADEVALAMFKRLLDPNICQAEIASTDRLASEIVTQVEDEQPSVVCIAALPPGGLAHARLLCKRLRQTLPQLKILVGRWGLDGSDVAANREELTEAGADLIGTTFEETTGQLLQLAQFLRPTTSATPIPSDSSDSLPSPAKQIVPAPHQLPVSSHSRQATKA